MRRGWLAALACLWALLPVQAVIAQEPEELQSTMETLSTVVDEIADMEGDPDNELAHSALQAIFGDFLWSFFGSCDPGDLDSCTESQGGVTLLAQVLGAVNMVALVLGIVILVYVMVGASVNTAAEGELLGREWDSYWAPIRSFMAFGLIMPLPGVAGGALSVVQVGVLYLIIVGSNGASWLWNFAIDAALADNPDMDVMTARPLMRTPAVPGLTQFFACARGQYVDSEMADPLLTVHFDDEYDDLRLYLSGPGYALPAEGMGRVAGAQRLTARVEGILGAARSALAVLRNLPDEPDVSQIHMYSGLWRRVYAEIDKSPVEWLAGDVLHIHSVATANEKSAQLKQELGSVFDESMNDSMKGWAKVTHRVTEADKKANAREMLKTLNRAKFSLERVVTEKEAELGVVQAQQAQIEGEQPRAIDLEKNRIGYASNELWHFFANLALVGGAVVNGAPTLIDAIGPNAKLKAITSGEHCGSVTFAESDLVQDPNDVWHKDLVQDARQIARVMLAGALMGAWRASDGAGGDGLSHNYGGGSTGGNQNEGMRSEVRRAMELVAAGVGGGGSAARNSANAAIEAFMNAMEHRQDLVAQGQSESAENRILGHARFKVDDAVKSIPMTPSERWSEHRDVYAADGWESSLLHPHPGAQYNNDAVRIMAVTRGHAYGGHVGVRELMAASLESGGANCGVGQACSGKAWHEKWRETITNGGWMKAGMFFFEIARPNVLRTEMEAEVHAFTVARPSFPPGASEAMNVNCDEEARAGALDAICRPATEAAAAVKASELALSLAGAYDPVFSREFALAGGAVGGQGGTGYAQFGGASTAAELGFVTSGMHDLLRRMGSSNRGSGSQMFGPLGVPDTLGVQTQAPQSGVVVDAGTLGMASPFLMLSNVGEFLKTAGITAFAGAALGQILSSAGGVGGVVEKMPGMGVVAKVLGELATFGFAIGIMLLSLGGTLAYLVPLLPLLTWIIMVASYLLSVVEAVAAAPLAVVMMATPEGKGIAGTKMQTAIQLATTIIMQPTLMVVGLIAATVLAGVFYSILNVMYVPVMTMTGSSILGMAFMLCLYVWVAFRIVRFSVMVMIRLPNQILEWFSTGAGSRFGDDMADASAGYAGQIDAKTGEVAGRLQQSHQSSLMRRPQDSRGRTPPQDSAPRTGAD